MTKADVEVGAAAILARAAAAYAVLGRQAKVVPATRTYCSQAGGEFRVCPLSAIFMAETKTGLPRDPGGGVEIGLGTYKWATEHLFAGDRNGVGGFINGVDGTRPLSDYHPDYYPASWFDVGFTAGREAVKRFAITNQ